jgi:hypothetical protein
LAARRTPDLSDGDREFVLSHRQFEWKPFKMTLQTDSQTSFSARVNPVHCFSVTGMADPGLMSRIMELWAKRGLVPQRWHGGRTGPDGNDVYIDIETAELDAALAEQVASAMRCIFGVSQVLMSEKRVAETA